MYPYSHSLSTTLIVLYMYSLTHTHCRHCLVQIIVTVSLRRQQKPLREQREQCNSLPLIFKQLGVCCVDVLWFSFFLFFFVVMAPKKHTLWSFTCFTPHPRGTIFAMELLPQKSITSK